MVGLGVSGAAVVVSKVAGETSASVTDPGAGAALGADEFEKLAIMKS